MDEIVDGGAGLGSGTASLSAIFSADVSLNLFMTVVAATSSLTYIVTV